MDNYFYDNKKRNTKDEKPKNAMTRVIIVQLILSLAVSGILFGVCKTESNLSTELKSFYGTICEKDIAVSRIMDVFKGVVKQTFSPIVNDTETIEM